MIRQERLRVGDTVRPMQGRIVRNVHTLYALILTFLAILFLPHAALAEPYFAAREGLKCAACHVNPSGGGMRNAFGNVWAQTTLAERRIEVAGAEIKS